MDILLCSDVYMNEKKIFWKLLTFVFSANCFFEKWMYVMHYNDEWHVMEYDVEIHF